MKDTLVRSEENKEMMDKAEVASTSYSIKAREKNMKSVGRIKFNES